MPVLTWPVAADGRYRIDVRIGPLDLAVMVDTGLVDSANAVGLEIDPAVYDPLRRTGFLMSPVLRKRRDASGRSQKFETSRASVRLFDRAAKIPVGPAANITVMRGVAGVPSRVGVVFFHQLTGGRVAWELSGRTWSTEYP